MSASDVPDQPIRELAYELWQENGCPTGEDDHFWYESERILQAPTAPAAAENSEDHRPQEEPASP